jgi:hypothetical protein
MIPAFCLPVIPSAMPALYWAMALMAVMTGVGTKSMVICAGFWTVIYVLEDGECGGDGVGQFIYNTVQQKWAHNMRTLPGAIARVAVSFFSTHIAFQMLKAALGTVYPMPLPIFLIAASVGPMAVSLMTVTAGLFATEFADLLRSDFDSFLSGLAGGVIMCEERVG